MSNFESLGLSNKLLRAINLEGYTHPTPVQAMGIPLLLDGKDLLGVAQTGTGKTAAFALPILQKLLQRDTPKKRHIRALILSPTRELAAQIDQRFSVYSQFIEIRHKVIFGGVSQKPQVQSLRRGIDVLVATPGRLLDLMQQGHIDLNYIEFFVLDEADRMLDMGFIRDIKKILAILPKRRQNLLFSATMPSSIADLAKSFLNNAEMIDLSPKEITVDKIEQSILFVRKEEKRKLIVDVVKEKMPNGVEYIAAYKKEGSIMNTSQYVVPESHYFFMGDNRDCSKDSRFLSSVGYVNEINLVGKARILFFSSDKSKGSFFNILKVSLL